MNSKAAMPRDDQTTRFQRMRVMIIDGGPHFRDEVTYATTGSMERPDASTHRIASKCRVTE
jgi:hypothetical protein